MTREGRTRYDNIYAASVARHQNIEIRPYTRQLAGWLCDIDATEVALLTELQFYLESHPQFQPYLRVFQRFEFGFRESVTLLIHIYPLEMFMVEGKRHRVNGNDKSLRAFKHRIGQGGLFRSSGDKSKMIKGGSSDCEQALWHYVNTRIAPAKSRPLTGNGALVAAYYAALESRYSPGSTLREQAVSSFKLRLSEKHIKRKKRQSESAIITGLLYAKTMSKLANMLYQELCRELGITKTI